MEFSKPFVQCWPVHRDDWTESMWNEWNWTAIKCLQSLILCTASGSVVERRTGDRKVLCSNPGGTTSELRQFNLPLCQLMCSCISETISLLSGVYARGSKTSHTGGMCRRLHQHLKRATLKKPVNNTQNMNAHSIGRKRVQSCNTNSKISSDDDGLDAIVTRQIILILSSTWSSSPRCQ